MHISNYNLAEWRSYCRLR